jgi:hypothetical protein
MVNRNKVVRTLSEGLRPSAYLAWIDQAYPMFTKVLLKPEAVIGDRGIDQPSVSRADGVPPSWGRQQHSQSSRQRRLNEQYAEQSSDQAVTINHAELGARK